MKLNIAVLVAGCAVLLAGSSIAKAGDCEDVASRVGHTDAAQILVAKLEQLTGKKQTCHAFLAKQSTDGILIANCMNNKMTKVQTTNSYAKGFSEGATAQYKVTTGPCTTK